MTGHDPDTTGTPAPPSRAAVRAAVVERLREWGAASVAQIRAEWDGPAPPATAVHYAVRRLRAAGVVAAIGTVPRAEGQGRREVTYGWVGP